MKKQNVKNSPEKWYENSYQEMGDSAQRKYPNEELIRFLGRDFFGTNKKVRQKIKMLEVGCGMGANLWPIAREGFSTYGIDISEKSIKLARKYLMSWGVNADLRKANMVKLPYKQNFFEVVFDVFSSYCLTTKEYEIFLHEVRRVLKKGGKFFSYTPSVTSQAFINYLPSEKIDEFTINGIKRKTSPFYGNDYPCRFTNQFYLAKKLKENNFKIEYLETVSRSYNSQSENFDFLVVVAIK